MQITAFGRLCRFIAETETNADIKMQWLFPEPLPFHSLAKTFLRIFGRSSMGHSSNDHRFCYNFRVYTYTRARSKCQHLLEPGHFNVAATTRTNAATKSWISLKRKFAVVEVHLLIYVALIPFPLTYTCQICHQTCSQIIQNPPGASLFASIPTRSNGCFHLEGDFGPFLQKE